MSGELHIVQPVVHDAAQLSRLPRYGHSLSLHNEVSATQSEAKQTSKVDMLQKYDVM